MADWDETKPAGGDAIAKGDDEIRSLKVQIRERMRKTTVFKTGNEASKSFNGVASSGESDTLTHSGASWDIDEWIDGFVVITAGTGQYQVRDVISNTVDTLQVDGAWTSPVPDSSSVYTVVQLDAGSGRMGKGRILVGTDTPDDKPTSATQGQLFYAADDKALWYYDGAAWVKIQLEHSDLSDIGDDMERTDLPATVAYDDEANIFTEDQTVATDISPTVKLDHRSSTDGQIGKIEWLKEGTAKAQMIADTSNNAIEFGTSGSSSKVSIGIGVDAGKLTTTGDLDVQGNMSVPIVRSDNASTLTAGTTSNDKGGYPQSGEGGEPHLRTIRGVIDGVGTVSEQYGTGWSVSRWTPTDGSVKGCYEVTFTTNFTGVPSVVVSSMGHHTVAQVEFSSVSGFHVRVYFLSESSQNRNVNFIAIGPSDPSE